MHIALTASTAILVATSAAAMQNDVPRRQPSDRDQLVCKSEPRTGSRFGRRNCQPRSVREKAATDAQRDTGEIRDRPFIPLCPRDC